MDSVHTDERIKEAVRDRYGDIARRFAEEPAAQAEGGATGTTHEGCCGQSETTVGDRSGKGCCGSTATVADDRSRESCCEPAEAVAESRSQEGCCPSSESSADCCATATRYYSTEELTGLPDSVSDASLGCGNPTAIAELRPGETVLDLGSGGGIDCFLAARQVGPEGKVIGLDMTTDMIKLARRNAKKIGATNVDFRYGEMEEMPLPDESVDVIISNCVVNLSPDKDAVFGEAYRVLRPGGRLSISDMVVDGDLPRSIRSRLDAWAGCVAGALDESVYLDKMRTAGFEDVNVQSREYMPADELADEVAQMVAGGTGGQASREEEAVAMLAETKLSPQELARKVASIKVRAYKPA